MLTASVTPYPNQSPPKVYLLVDGVDGGDTTVRVSRMEPEGTFPVRGAEPAANRGGGGVPVTDYECPFGTPFRYLITTSDGQRHVTAEMTVNPAAFYPNDQGFTTSRGAVWLRHLTNPMLSMPIDLANAESPVFTQTRSVSQVLNRRTPIVLTDARRKQLTSTLDIRTWSLAEAARLRELLADNSVLLLSVPAAERWGITSWYVAVGDVTEERLWQEWAPYEGRVFHLPVEIVDRPTGGAVYPPCSYWYEQRNVNSYYEFDVKHDSYAKLSACHVVPTGDPLDPGDTSGKWGIKYFWTTQDSDTDGAVRGPGLYQSNLPLAAGGNTFFEVVEGEPIKIVAEYNIRSSEQVMTLAIYLQPGTQPPDATQTGALISNTDEDPVTFQRKLQVLYRDPIELPPGNYSVSFAVYSNGQWVEAGMADTGNPRTSSGVWVLSPRYTYFPGQTPDVD